MKRSYEKLEAMFFELKMRPTLDCSIHLMNQDAQLKVLEPEWLAEEIIQMHLDAMAMYDERV